MNPLNYTPDQINSVIRTILKIAGALLLQHGLTNSATVVNSPDVLGALSLIVGLVWSHFQHGTGDTANPRPPGGPGASVICWALIACLALPLTFTGCSTTATTAGYKTAAAASITIDAAMTAWGDYVAANHPPAAQEIQVKNLFEKYQAAELLAVDTVETLSTNNPAGLAGFQAATGQAGQALTDLVNLLISFGVKL